MFATPSQQQQQQQQQQATAQYTLMSGQQPQQGQGSEDMFFALERLLMGISPFPPTIPTLAKPTCPSLDDQIMAEIQATSSPSIPSIVLNEQSLDLLQQYYQNQDNSLQSLQYNNYSGCAIDQSDCSSTSRSASPPNSPYSYSSSLVSSPAMPLASESYWMTPTMPAQQQQQQQQQDWDVSLFDQMNLPLTMAGLENYIAPTATDLLSEPLLASQSLKQATSSSPSSSSKKVKPHHRRTSSNCSAISAYESTARREHRASSISSVCSTASATSNNNNNNTNSNSNVRPIKSYACPTCTKPFPTRTQLKSHMAIHTDSFPFPCMHAGCELHFKRKHDLRRHIDAKHALVKKYLCTGGCGEGFGRRDQMVRHLRRGACGQGQGFQTD
ncbi:hypothetical protein BGZ80_002443 [Entomortierella chlamydospora]|uniref:C2H2-type domain-containing protein n=1 Tax=Entomortierella chlamydospora TaxID=101097 RepID=A0A9P6MPP0_9FUNG|nr:hypothetical protein BGZ79_000322 [Entomortierella chlamydospora]KAG0009399.1 hypothetical protein BGZ80_002443 [Entomortierella chlamydospora]